LSVPKSKTILVLEDEPLVREVFEHVLRSTGFVVISTASTNAALEAFSRLSDDIDFLLADISIPDGSGMQLASACVRKSTKLRIIITSGSPQHLWNDDDRRIFEDLPSGHFTLLLKPFLPSKLLHAINGLMGPPGGYYRVASYNAGL
jgi:CheY-like chemotaxis protein